MYNIIYIYTFHYYFWWLLDMFRMRLLGGGSLVLRLQSPPSVKPTMYASEVMKFVFWALLFKFSNHTA